MEDLTVDVYANTEDAIKDINELREAVEDLSDAVDELEAKGVEVEITTNDD